jgi:hypothetical protein
MFLLAGRGIISVTILFSANRTGWRRPEPVLYYNIAEFARFAGKPRPIMTHHHHHGGVPHPSPSLSPSLLRLSAAQRLAGSGVLIALVWAAFFWAIR